MKRTGSVASGRGFAATAFEEKYRLWIITVLYLIALACFRFNRRDIGFTVAPFFASHIPVLITARAFYFLAALLAFLAAFLASWTAVSSPMHSGPYRFVRRPQYLATILLFLGFGLLLNPLGFALLLVGMAALFRRLYLRDEPTTALRVPDRPAKWRIALLRSAYLWAFGATLVTLAVTLQERPFYIALVLSLLLQAATFLGRRQAAHRSL